jgi:hypothetical protein
MMIEAQKDYVMVPIIVDRRASDGSVIGQVCACNWAARLSREVVSENLTYHQK